MISKLRYPYGEILEKLLECLKKNFDLVSAVVFGSVARGDTKKDSDIGILIVADNLPDRYERFKMFEKAEGCVEEKIRELQKKGYHVFLSPIIKSKEAKKITPYT